MIPEIFKIGSISVSGYQLFFSLGIVFGSLVILCLSKKEKLDRIETVNFIILGIVSLVLGSKLYGVIYNYTSSPGYYSKNLDELLDHFLTGGVFYGGLIALVIFAVFYLRRFFKGKEWQVLDITAIGCALGHFFGRIGCFMAGCCYGYPTDLPWGVKIPFLTGEPHPFRQTAVHPTQLYEAFFNLVNFCVLFLIWRRKKFPGQVPAFYFINYGIIRFVVEYFRNDGGRGYLFKGNSIFLSLSFPQLISVVLIITGIIILKIKRKKAGSKLEYQNLF